MLKVVKAKKYRLIEKITDKRFKISPEWQGNDILSKRQSQSTLILAILFFFLKIPVLPLFCGIFLSNLFVYLVAVGNIMWKLENRNFYDQP